MSAPCKTGLPAPCKTGQPAPRRASAGGSKRRVLISDINPALLRKAFSDAPCAALNTSKKKKSKYGNEKTEDGFDSRKEKRVVKEIELMVRARAKGYENVVSVDRQKAFVLIPSQFDPDGKVIERELKYVADLVLIRGDGAMSVYDVKSVATRKNRAYIIKRKLMLHVHGVRIIEC